MGFERPGTPEEEKRDTEAFLGTLGPVMLVNGYTSAVTLVRDAESGGYSPTILVRFEGRENRSIEMVTSTVMMCPEDAEHLVQMLAEQTVAARHAPLPEPGWEPPLEG